jgi:chemotaxis regulatin CheY-phosphate phosphatase CheZ
MIKNDIDVLLKKADELRALFILGQKVIPFLEDVFVFVKDIQPVLDNINESIKDNLNKMPSASKQLSKVTEATELATTEIMDIVDGLVYKSDIIVSNLNKMHEIQQKQYSKPLELLELISVGISRDADLKAILPEIKATVKYFKKDSNEKFIELVNNTKDILNSINQDSSSIMMSLQVQDITSQQIAAVNNLLEMIQGKLSMILNHYQGTGMEEVITRDENQQPQINVSKLHRDIAFDPDAVDSISMRGNRQNEVDILMEKELQNEVDRQAENEMASQEDIDAFFNDNSDSNTGAEEEETAEEKNKDDAPKDDEDENSDEPISQDEIDRILSGTGEETREENSGEDYSEEDGDDANEMPDNDEIDKLFNTK